MTPLPILVAVGLRREARPLRRAGFTVAIGGGDPRALRRRLAEAAEAMAAAGRPPQAVLSFGIAGALAPRLRLAELVLAEAIHDGPVRLPCDGELVRRLAAALPAARRGDLAAADAMLVAAADKAALHLATHALAVDMESGVAARFAAERRLPVAALRVISDEAAADLPPAVRAGMTPDGGMNALGVAAALLRTPAQLPAVLRLARHAGSAFTALDPLPKVLARALLPLSQREREGPAGAAGGRVRD